MPTTLSHRSARPAVHAASALVLALAAWSLPGAARADVVAGPAAPEGGVASVYHDKYDGRRTASGKRFRQDRLTAAHRTLPFGSRVTAVNLATGRSVEVEITDRGPFIDGRVIDLSRRAAEAIGMRGLAPVVIMTD